MKRAWPLLVFAAITLAVFWKFLLFGYTLYPAWGYDPDPQAEVVETGFWFPSERHHQRVPDNLLLLPGHLRIYNEVPRFQSWYPADRTPARRSGFHHPEQSPLRDAD